MSDEGETRLRAAAANLLAALVKYPTQVNHWEETEALSAAIVKSPGLAEATASGDVPPTAAQAGPAGSTPAPEPTEAEKELAIYKSLHAYCVKYHDCSRAEDGPSCGCDNCERVMWQERVEAATAKITDLEQVASLNGERLDLLRKKYAGGLTDAELALLDDLTVEVNRVMPRVDGMMLEMMTRRELKAANAKIARLREALREAMAMLADTDDDLPAYEVLSKAIAETEEP
jgi:hypothetical protein